MGVFPEPARCADDVGGRMPATLGSAFSGEDESVAWLPRSRLRRQVTGVHSFAALPRTGRARRATIALGLLVGFGLPQSAFAPAGFTPTAQAHDRIDLGPKAALPLTDLPSAAASAPVGSGVWENLTPPEQDPPTTALIEDNLATLPRVTQEDGEDAVRFGARTVPLKVVDTIVKASEEAGVDPVYMMALADKESSFDTDAKATRSSAQGLFQFVKATWLELIRDFGARHGLTQEAAAVKGSGPGITVAGGMQERVLSLRNDPRVAAQMAAELIKRDRDRIEARVGRRLSTTELYLAHFLGTASAGRFLSLNTERPDETAAKAFRAAARANRSLFTQREGSRRRHLTIAEFHDRIGDMIDERLARYRGVTAVAAATATQDQPPPGSAPLGVPPDRGERGPAARRAVTRARSGLSQPARRHHATGCGAAPDRRFVSGSRLRSPVRRAHRRNAPVSPAFGGQLSGGFSAMTGGPFPNPRGTASSGVPLVGAARLDAMSVSLARNWWLVALRGVISILFGAMALFAPAAFVLSLVLFFAAYMLVDGIFTIVGAIRAAQRHERWGFLLIEGLVDLLVGAAAFLVPAAAVWAFVLLLAAWAFVTGGLMIAAAFRLHLHYGRWWLILGGVISLLFGLALVIAPGMSALVLTWWLGGYAIAFGVMLVILAFQLRNRHTVGSGTLVGR